MAEGKSRKEVAAILGISVKTVEFHKAALARQLELRNMGGLYPYAIDHGLISSK